MYIYLRLMNGTKIHRDRPQIRWLEIPPQLTQKHKAPSTTQKDNAGAVLAETSLSIFAVHVYHAQMFVPSPAIAGWTSTTKRERPVLSCTTIRLPNAPHTRMRAGGRPAVAYISPLKGRSHDATPHAEIHLSIPNPTATKRCEDIF